MEFSATSLSDLQRRLLEAFFGQETGFFLTGGGALAGFFLGHRTTDDLDLFTTDEAAFERGPHVLAEVVERLGGELKAVQQAPGFHRYFVRRAGEGVVVDLVLDRVPQIYVEKLDRGGIPVDPPAEILVNKLSAIAGRCEIRDVVDVMALEKAGLSVEEALDAALRKDGGCTPATLAWVLSELEIPDGATLPGGVTGGELRQYVSSLVGRLRRASAPPSQ
jgi:hypothetical protein